MKETLDELISDYKTYIAKSKMQDEVYKWELVNKYKGRPDTEAKDFTAEIKSIKFQNLIYAMSIAVINHLAKDKPEELRALFIELFNESQPLKDRIVNFNEDSLVLYRSLGETLGHHQDERAIAAYLTFHNPEKYTLYKSTFYKKFCELMGVESKGKNEKYVHYLELLDQFIVNYIEPDKELIAKVKGYIPEYYDGKNHLLLAQDILFCMLNKGRDEGEDIFPVIEKFLDQAELGDLKTSSYPKAYQGLNLKVSFGQGVSARIPWIGLYKDPNTISKGIYPVYLYYKEHNTLILAYGVSETEKSEQVWGNTDNLTSISEWYSEKFNEKPDRYGASFIKAIYNLESDLDPKKIRSDLKDLLKEYDQVDFSNDEHFEKFLAKYNEKDLKTYFVFMDEIISRNNLSLGDKRLSFTYYDDRLNLTVGQRYSWNLFASESRGNFGVLSKEKISEASELFEGSKPRPWYTHMNDFNPSIEERVNIHKGITFELNRTEVSGHRRHNKEDFEKYAFERINNTVKMNQPINQILYGPPGTGKTYHLKSELFPLYTTQETSLSKEKYFEQKVEELTWWQVAALALMETNNLKVGDIQNNRWISTKAAMSESKNVRATLWGTLQMHTIEESNTVAYTQRQPPLIFNKNEDKTWTLLEQEAKEQVPELYELLDDVNNFNPNPDKQIKRYTFCTFHQSYGYEDFIEGIKPIMSGEGEQVQLSYQIQEGVFKEICRRAENDPENRYAIFIDEINRGNVSSIFGELITLIESDKRIGMPNEMRASLPYSKRSFGVPSNVDIYGTMNTADRSVEALDTALRRRFSFVERMPDSSLLSDQVIDNIQLKELLDVINERIEALVDRDHTIGHAYFMNVKDMKDLRATFKDKIIPLLQEYFYGDYGKIGLVLGEGFVDVDIKEDSIFSSFQYEGRESLSQTSYTLKSFEDIDFEEALKQLFNKK